MFAVPGWSVSAANLASESAGNNTNSKGPEENGSDGNNAAGPGKNKKRKRPSGSSTGNVNAGNVATLWERVIEGKSGKKARVDPRPKKQSHGEDGDAAEAGAAGEAGGDGTVRDAGKKGENGAPNGEAKLTLKEKKKRKKAKEAQSGGKDGVTPSTEAKEQAPPVAPPPPQPKLTPLQASMREKLISARFRHLNETLYTKPSADALELFAESPEMFEEYHEGFRRQVNVWPENPVDGYIEDIKVRGQQTPAPRDKGKASAQAAAAGAVAPLLRTRGVCTIADLGCGDAKISATLQPLKKRLRLKVLSFDLQSPSPHVTKADSANLPLEDGSVNTVIFCLALMGTNWLDFIEEAYRVLHWKGELWIAEIKSRFAPPSTAAARGGKKVPVAHSVGNRKRPVTMGKKPNKGSDAAAAAAAADSETLEADLAVEVDGADDRRQETDVSAFVEALRKRGFVLQGEGTAAVDLSNRMFVKMHFTKGAPALVGKNFVPPKEASRTGGDRRNAPPKFIDREDRGKDRGKVDESSILKPCVYKLR